MGVVIAEKYYADFLPQGVPVLNYPVMEERKGGKERGARSRGRTEERGAGGGGILNVEHGMGNVDLGELSRPPATRQGPLEAGRPDRDAEHVSRSMAPSTRPARPLINDACAHWLFYSGSVTRVRGALYHARMSTLVPGVGVYSAGRCSPMELAEEMRDEAQRTKNEERSTNNEQRSERQDTKNEERRTKNGARTAVSGQQTTDNEQPTTNNPGPASLIIEGEGFSVNRQRLDELAMNYHWLAGLAIFPKTEHYRRKELTKFFEYMQAGMPILCSDMPAWKDFVEEQRIGLTVDPEDPEDQREKIQYLIDHPDECRAMGERGRELVETEYNWQTQADRLLGLYDDLLRNRPPRRQDAKKRR